MKRILLVAVAVIVGVPLLVTAWFYIGGIETGDTSLPDDADLLWSPPEVADEDNAFIAIMAATNLINCTTLGTNSWDKVDMSFVSGYANINTNRDSTARRIRADPGAGEMADRIIADNQAFYAAFAKGLERNEFRNADPIIEELGYPFPSVLLYMRMAQFWRLKIRREAERGEWEKAANSLEVLRRFGRFVSDGKANRFPEFSIGIMLMENVLNEMVGLVVMGGYGEDSLLRFAAIAKEDEAAFSSNCTHVVRGEYTHIVAELPKKRAADLLRTLDCDSSFRRICPVLEHWPFYRDFALGERWTRRRLADVAHSFLRGEIDYAVYERFYPGNPFVRNWAGRERVYGFALCCGNLLGGSWGTGGSCVCTRVRSLSLQRRGGGSPMTAKCRRRLMRLFRSIFLQFLSTLGRKTASPSTMTRQLVSCGRSASREISITPNCLLRSQNGFAASLAEMWIALHSVSTASRLI